MSINRLTQRGMSLMEVLVVLVLVGMLSALLLQSSMFLYGNFERVTYQQNRQWAAYLPTAWFRDSIAGLIVSRDEQFIFSGESGRMQGLTIRPVLGDQGALTWIEWSIHPTSDQIELHYSENDGQSEVIYRWVAEGAQFTYIGENGEVFPAWPLEEDDAGSLPRAVVLKLEQDDHTTLVDASVQVRTFPPADYRDLL